MIILPLLERSVLLVSISLLTSFWSQIVKFFTLSFVNNISFVLIIDFVLTIKKIL